MDIQGKVALITGGSKGIGLSIAESILAKGGKVALTSRNQGELNSVVSRLNESYPEQSLGVRSDARLYEEQVEAVQKTIEKWGRLDVVIANAGIGKFAPIDEMTLDQWNDVIDINLTGAFYTIKASVEELKKSKGYYLSIASLAGTNFFARGAAYNASKFGLVGFTQAIMLDLRKYGIKVSTIMPGSVATYFNGHVPTDEDAWKIQPEDIGKMVVDLLEMPARTLPSKIEVRPSIPPSR
ncbi:MAG: SDR family oxidoreductase [Bacteroidota bacterium]